MVIDDHQYATLIDVIRVEELSVSIQLFVWKSKVKHSLFAIARGSVSNLPRHYTSVWAGKNNVQ